MGPPFSHLGYGGIRLPSLGLISAPHRTGTDYPEQ